MSSALPPGDGSRQAVAKKEPRMPTDTAAPADVTLLVVKLARFAVFCTVAFGAVLLSLEALGSRGGTQRPGFLTDGTTATLLWVIAAEVVSAMTALTVLSLWKR
jgi:hypothetical protein